MMTPQRDLILALLLGASVIQGLFFALASFSRPGPFSNRLVLSCLFLAMAIGIAHAPALYGFFHPRAALLIWATEPTQFLLAPLAWLYVHKILKGGGIAAPMELKDSPKMGQVPLRVAEGIASPMELKDSPKMGQVPLRVAEGMAIRFWPHTLLFVLAIPVLLLRGKLFPPAAEPLISGLMSLIFSAQVLYYLALSHRALVAARRDREAWSSHPDPDGVAWLTPLLAGLTITWLLQVPLRFYLAHGGPVLLLQDLLSLLLGLLVFVLAFFSLRRGRGRAAEMSVARSAPQASEMTTGQGLPSGPGDGGNAMAGKSTNLPDPESRVLFEDLERLMAEGHSYRQPSLTIRHLAALMDLPYWRLSQVINANTGSHFFDYVNRHRVNEVAARLAGGAPSGQSILALALEAGFSSKAAFNKAYKKHRGHTPRQTAGS